MRIKVIRGFMSNGKPVPVGTELDVEDQAGHSLVWMGKAELAGPAPPAPKGPMTTETAAAVVGGKKPKE